MSIEDRWCDGCVYLQVRHHRYAEVKVMKATQRRPSVLEPGCVLVRIKLRMPYKAFQPLEPEAEVTIPAELVQTPIEVEATG